MAETYGFVGLGTMGMPTVRTLAAKGFQLVVYDVRPDAVAEAAALDNVASASSPREVAERATIVAAFLPQIENSLEVFLGANGVIEAARKDLVTCDHSSVLPTTAKRIAQELRARGVAHLDAPVLGGARNCEEGTLTIVVSGDEAAYARARAEIEALSKTHHYVGEVGKASAIKLMQNALGLVQTGAMAETFALCKEVGVEPQLFYDVVAGGGGQADTWVFRGRGRKMVERDYDVVSFIDVPAKDSRLAVEMACEVGLDTPLLRESMRYFQDAKEAGWARRDVAIVANVIDLRRGRIKPADV